MPSYGAVAANDRTRHTDLARFKSFAKEMGMDVDVFVRKAKEKGKNIRWLEVSIGGGMKDMYCFTSNGNFNGVKHYASGDKYGEEACFTVRHRE